MIGETVRRARVESRWHDARVGLGRHEAGDAALVHTAEMIAASIRPSDFATRFGGDEFMILLPSTTAQQATVVAQRI